MLNVNHNLIVLILKLLHGLVNLIILHHSVLYYSVIKLLHKCLLTSFTYLQYNS